MSRMNKYIFIGLALLGAASVISTIIAVTIVLVYSFVLNL